MADPLFRFFFFGRRFLRRSFYFRYPVNQAYELQFTEQINHFIPVFARNSASGSLELYSGITLDGGKFAALVSACFVLLK